MSKNGKNFTLVGIGEILWDMLPDGKQLGGAPANFAYHAQTLGGRGAVVSSIGNDKQGKEILNRLDELGLDKKFVTTDSNHPTGTVSVELDEQGKPSYIIHENVAWDFIPAGRSFLKLATEANGVCFGSLCQRCSVSAGSIRQFLQATKPDCIRIFDVNLRQRYFSRDIINDMLELSNVFKLNDEELPAVAEMLSIEGSESDILARLTERYDLCLIALTRGANGSRLYAQGKNSIHKGFSVRVVDTVGAGDSFAAAITLGLLRADSLEQINEKANRLAGFVCSRSGATPKVPPSLL